MEEFKGYSKLTYILCAFFLGGLGVHSFIAKKPIQGILFIVATILGYLTIILFGLGFFILFIEYIIIIIQIVIAASKQADQYGNIK